MKFSQLVERIRRDRGLDIEVPGFDPANGNENAKFLFLFEAPGPKALKSGRISFDNPDPSARNFREQLAAAGISRTEIAVWNTVPWYIGNEDRSVIRSAVGSDIAEGIEYLKPLIAAMPTLEFIILVGAAARKAHVFLSRITTVRIVSCHHTSARAQNANRAAAKENVDVLRFIKGISQASGANKAMQATCEDARA
jgi:uracil-DNA glycosylase